MSDTFVSQPCLIMMQLLSGGTHLNFVQYEYTCLVPRKPASDIFVFDTIKDMSWKPKMKTQRSNTQIGAAVKTLPTDMCDLVDSLAL